MWTDFSVHPVLPMQFVRTRWQSKYGMLKSLLANKGSVRRMCASDDECCSALHDQDLSDAEWKIIEVRLFSVFAAIAQRYGGLDRNHCPFSNAWLRSRSCSRVRIMCCHRHIGELSLMWKRRWLFMPQILPRLQPFGKRCTMIISTRE